jgi:hypothetical protein
MPRGKRKSPVSVVPSEGSSETVRGTEGEKTPRVKKSSSEKKLAAFYSKYGHVVSGSVREPTAAELKELGHSSGKCCTINCVDCKAERVVNLQDVFQVKRCVECKAKFTKAHRADKQAKRKKSA